MPQQKRLSFSYLCLSASQRLRAISSPSLPFHSNERYQPFFIVSCGRSGTTLLRRILEAGEGIHIPGEIWCTRKVIAGFRELRYMGWETCAAMVVGSYLMPNSGEARFQEGARVLEELATLPKKSRSLATVMNAVYRQFCRECGKPEARWGDKTPVNVLRMDAISSVFPDAIFLHLLRDGADVIPSLMKLYQETGLPVDANSLAGAANRWKNSFLAARKFGDANPGRFLEVRYENLVRSPADTVKGVCQILGIEFRESMLSDCDVSGIADIKNYAHHANALCTIDKKIIGKGRRQLDKSALKELYELIGPELEIAGYL